MIVEFIVQRACASSGYLSYKKAAGSYLFQDLTVYEYFKCQQCALYNYLATAVCQGSSNFMKLVHT